jgi:hypothetical protein
VPGRNIWGLTNRQLMVGCLQHVLVDAEANDGRVSAETLMAIRSVLTEVVRNKRPTTTIKESKRI